MKKLLYILYFFPIISYSGDFISHKYKFYDCNENADFKTCGNGCSLKEDFLVQFKYNTSGNKVDLIAYSKGVISGTINFENCTFIDNKNWVCNYHSYDSANDEHYRYEETMDQTQGMTNNIFTMKSLRSLRGYDRKLNTSKLFYCAKEDSFFN